jgi:2-polyprenyl-6-methoxyphenol hydroxylase-like FAD-dependent oxidoreductase
MNKEIRNQGIGMSKHIPALIIGAGPTGLLMGCILARFGVPFRIIDKKPERTLTANAVGIQTRTLELLDNLGIVHHFIKAGHECKAIHIHQEGKDLAHIPLDQLDSTYRFILALPQSETERLLTEHLIELGAEVERPLELRELKHEEGHLNCVLTSLENDQSETLTCDWLLACDGANSKVRELCDLPFPGEDLSEQFMVANAEMSSFLSNSQIHLFLNPGTLLATIPFGSHSFRVAVNLHQSPRKFLVEKEVKEFIQERSQGDYDVTSVSWISPFWIHSKIVKELRYGSVFLLGDAAHIHSPAGAQGMNTGLQDAYNLAWKLALVIQGKAKLTLLDSYQEERYPLVSQIVKRSERFTKMILLENPLLLSLRTLFFKILNKQPKLIKKITMQLTQLSLSYKKSSIIHYRGKIHPKAPQPGERVPDVYINQTARLHVYLRTMQHKVLLFTGQHLNENDLARLTDLQQWLSEHYPETIKTFIISDKKLSGQENLILDEKMAIHQRYQVKTPALYLIRPDNYIAYCSKNLAPARLQTVLDVYLT